jgi:hypothetical protein
VPVPTKHLHWKTTVSQPPSITLRLGDSRQVLAEYPDEHFDSVVCDPPYELAFMGREWDKQGIAFEVSFWTEVLRVLKPGGHLLAFGGTRTYHRMVCAIEDAGFEVRDSIHWLYGTGFPKSLDVSKAIDKAAGQIGKSVVALKRELARHFNASGKTRKQVDDECGFRASNYLTLPATGKRPDPWVHVLPTEEKWTRMKEVLGCAGDQVLDEAFRAAVREVRISNAEIAAAAWPGPPRAGENADRIVIDGQERIVMAIDTRYIGEAAALHVMQVRG